MIPRLLIFDDGRGRFGPLTDRRAVFSLRTGAYTNRVRIELLLGRRACDLVVHPRLDDLYGVRETDAWVNKPLRRNTPISFYAHQDGGTWSPMTVDADASILLVNGRWSGGLPVELSVIRDLAPSTVLTQSDGQLIAAHLAVDQAQKIVDHGFTNFSEGVAVESMHGNVLIERPWHILDQLEHALEMDLAGFKMRTSDKAAIHRSAVIIEDAGPVIVDDASKVGPLAVLEGPCFIGRHCVIQARSLIRSHSVIGPFSKIGGEVSSSIVQGYSNKSHEGYLGHTLVGEWCNLGAGTTVSNLKNTYGPVRVGLGPGEELETTGRRFCGPLIGDFVRTAIGSRIPTGAVLGTGSSVIVSGFSPKCTGRFRFITDGGDAIYDLDRFLDAARIAMARRDVELSKPEEQVLRDLARL